LLSGVRIRTSEPMYIIYNLCEKLSRTHYFVLARLWKAAQLKVE
jgi:hypothetical protein